MSLLPRDYLIGEYRGDTCAVEKQAFYQGDLSRLITLESGFAF